MSATTGGHLNSRQMRNFRSKIDPTTTADGCLRWTAAANRYGRGQFGVNGHQMFAPRISWELAHGQAIPDGLVIRHTCDHPWCVNPEHLELGTQLDNIRDRGRRRRTAHLRGEQHGEAKLTEDQVAEMRELYETGDYTQRELAIIFHTCRPNVSRIVRGLRWVSPDSEGVA